MHAPPLHPLPAPSSTTILALRDHDVSGRHHDPHHGDHDACLDLADFEGTDLGEDDSDDDGWDDGDGG